MALIKNILCRIFADMKKNRVILCAILFYMALTQFLFHSVCPSAILFGFPCPACGLTRAGLLLLRGDLAGAFEMHPAIFPWAAFLLYLCFFRYVLGKKAPYETVWVTAIGISVLTVYVVRLISDTLPDVLARGLLTGYAS